MARPPSFVAPFLSMLVCLAAAAPLPAQESPSLSAVERAELEADLEQLLDWFSGRFDSYWQAREHQEQEVEHPNGRIHSIFAPVSVPAVGEHVFYVQQYGDGDPDAIYRQRLYRFGIDAAEKKLELVIFALPDPEAALDAHLEPSKVADLRPEDLRSYPGCEVHWWRVGRGTDGDHFLGATRDDACRVVSSRSGRTLLISDDLRLDARSIWIQDRAVDEQGDHVYGNRAGIPHKLGKVRFFDCWAAQKRAPSEVMEGESEWHGWRGLSLHDQGGRAELVVEGEDTWRHAVELFQAVYRGEHEVPVLELAVHEQGKEKSVAYTWASPETIRIGIHLRDVLQSGCTLVPDRRF